MKKEIEEKISEFIYKNEVDERLKNAELWNSSLEALKVFVPLLTQSIIDMVIMRVASVRTTDTAGRDLHPEVLQDIIINLLKQD